MSICSTALTPLKCSNFISRPLQVAKRHYRLACQKPQNQRIQDVAQPTLPRLTPGSKLRHFTLALLLSIPLLNTITYLILRSVLKAKIPSPASSIDQQPQPLHRKEQKPTEVPVKKQKKNQKNVGFKEVRMRQFDKAEAPNEINNQNSLVLPVEKGSYRSLR